jgi:hypothetical protein
MTLSRAMAESTQPDPAMNDFLHALDGVVAKQKVMALCPDAQRVFWHKTGMSIACGWAIVIPSRRGFYFTDHEHFGLSEGQLWKLAHDKLMSDIAAECELAFMQTERGVFMRYPESPEPVGVIEYNDDTT